MLFEADYRGPLTFGSRAYREWDYEELEKRAEAVLGKRWKLHVDGLFGLSVSTLHQYKNGKDRGRSVPRRVAFTIAVLEEIAQLGGQIPKEFCDYEIPPLGRPRKDVEEAK